MKLKKVVAVVAALCLAACMLALVACGGDKYANSKYVGTWEAKTAEAMGISMEVSKIMDEFTIVLEANGNATAKVDGQEGSGSWEETETGVKLAGGIGQQDLEFADEDGKLVIDYSGAKIFFEKQAE